MSPILSISTSNIVSTSHSGSDDNIALIGKARQIVSVCMSVIWIVGGPCIVEPSSEKVAGAKYVSESVGVEQDALVGGDRW